MTQTNSDLSVSEKARLQVARIRERDGKPQAILRVSVVGGGCSGLSYKLSFEDAAGESDVLMDFEGLKVVVDPKSILFLKGMILDFTDGLTGQGFVFQNPNAKQTCGCGSSFSA